jgi:hypothetical protein
MAQQYENQKEVYVGRYGLVKKHDKFSYQVLAPNGRHFAYIPNMDTAKRMVDKPLTK